MSGLDQGRRLPDLPLLRLAEQGRPQLLRALQRLDGARRRPPPAARRGAPSARRRSPRVDAVPARRRGHRRHRRRPIVRTVFRATQEVSVHLRGRPRGQRATVGATPPPAVSGLVSRRRTCQPSRIRRSERPGAELVERVVPRRAHEPVRRARRSEREHGGDRAPRTPASSRDRRGKRVFTEEDLLATRGAGPNSIRDRLSRRTRPVLSVPPCSNGGPCARAWSSSWRERSSTRSTATRTRTSPATPSGATTPTSRIATRATSPPATASPSTPASGSRGTRTFCYVLLLAPAFLIARDSAILPLAVALNAAVRRGRARRCSIAACATATAGGPAALAAVLFAAWPALWLWNASGMETALVLLLQVALWAEVTRDDGARASGRSSWCSCCWSSRARTASSARGSPSSFLALRRDCGARARGRPRGRAVHRGPGGLAARVLRPSAAQHLLREGLGPARRPHRATPRGSSAISPSAPACCRTSSCWPRPRWSRRARGGCPSSPSSRRAGSATGSTSAATSSASASCSCSCRWAPRCSRGGRRRAAACWPRPASSPRCSSSSLPLAADRRFRYAGAKYDRWIELGRFLGRPEHRGKTIAVDAAGKIPYYSRLAAIDMLGLTDAHIGHQPAATFRVGHNKHDAEYVLARRPDLIATWIDEDLDLRWDLDRARYEAAGYRLRWLVYVAPLPARGPRGHRRRARDGSGRGAGPRARRLAVRGGRARA